MKLEQFEQVLVDGGRNELVAFGNSRNCIVIDWRDNVETIIAAVGENLPKGYWIVRKIDEQTVEIDRRGEIHSVVARADSDLEPLLQSINRLIFPEYEMRILKATMGDGYSLLLRPSNWWVAFAASHPARFRDIFVTIDERVRQTGTVASQQSSSGVPAKSKTWWRSLFGE